jgi:hypothetical protein
MAFPTNPRRGKPGLLDDDHRTDSRVRGRSPIRTHFGQLAKGGFYPIAKVPVAFTNSTGSF